MIMSKAYLVQLDYTLNPDNFHGLVEPLVKKYGGKSIQGGTSKWIIVSDELNSVNSGLKFYPTYKFSDTEKRDDFVGSIRKIDGIEIS